MRVYSTMVDTDDDDEDSHGQPVEEAEQRLVRIYVTAGAWYLFGAEARYLKEGSIRREDGQVRYDINESNTDILMAYVGVSVRI